MSIHAVSCCIIIHNLNIPVYKICSSNEVSWTPFIKIVLIIGRLVIILLHVDLLSLFLIIVPFSCHQEGADNPALASVAGGMGGIGAKGTSGAGGSVNISGLLPGNKACSCYDGSLTTPPLTESVKWIVMNEPISVGGGQVSLRRN